MKDSVKNSKPGRPKSKYTAKVVSFRIRTHWEKEFRNHCSVFIAKAYGRDNDSEWASYNKSDNSKHR